MTTKQPDWEAIERASRAGLLSTREIASAQGITHGAINKRAKRDGWERDLKVPVNSIIHLPVQARQPVHRWSGCRERRSDRSAHGPNASSPA